MFNFNGSLIQSKHWTSCIQSKHIPCFSCAILIWTKCAFILEMETVFGYGIRSFSLVCHFYYYCIWFVVIIPDFSSYMFTMRASVFAIAQIVCEMCMHVENPDRIWDSFSIELFVLNFYFQFLFLFSFDNNENNESGRNVIQIKLRIYCCHIAEYSNWIFFSWSFLKELFHSHKQN